MITLSYYSIQAIFMIIQLVISTHIDVSATIGGLHQELNCHCSLDGVASLCDRLGGSESGG